MKRIRKFLAGLSLTTTFLLTASAGMAAALFLEGCGGDDKVVTARTPQHCTDAAPMVGTWESHEHNRGGQFDLTLSVKETADPCELAFTFSSIEWASGLLVYRTQGILLVADAETVGSLTNVLIEARRESIYQRPSLSERDPGNTEYGDVIYERSQAKVWDDALRLWSKDYERRS